MVSNKNSNQVAAYPRPRGRNHLDSRDDHPRRAKGGESGAHFCNLGEVVCTRIWRTNLFT